MDARQAAIKRAIGALASGVLTEAETFAKVINAIEETPRESVAAARQSRRERMLAEYYRLQPTLGRSTAATVARMHANDRRDPVEVESLTRQLRRWVAEEKRTVSVC
jgi:hypothetical protein